MSILLFDNYDSFTYNIAHQLCELKADFEVYRNDKIDIGAVAGYDKIILSPGPGIPKEAGNMLSVIDRYASEKSILGVCLGHQAIGEVFGASLMLLPDVYHGVATLNHITAEDYILRGIPETFRVGRYHSWVIDPSTVPDAIEVTSIDDDNEIMSIRHKTLDVRGVQFHPESILTEYGLNIIRNFINGPEGGSPVDQIESSNSALKS